MCGDDSVKIDEEQTIIEVLDKHNFGKLNAVRTPFGINDPQTPEGFVPLLKKCITIPKRPTITDFQSLARSLPGCPAVRDQILPLKVTNRRSAI